MGVLEVRVCSAPREVQKQNYQIVQPRKAGSRKQIIIGVTRVSLQTTIEFGTKQLCRIAYCTIHRCYAAICI